MMDRRLQLSEIERIATSPGWRRDRVEVFDVGAGRVIAKGHRPLRAPGQHRVLNAIAWFVGVPFLRAVPVHGGAAAQAVEIRRLQALSDVGVPVPQVLHVADDFFVMQWLGASNLALMIGQRHPAAFTLWQQGARALAQVHAVGQYLSQSFSRNMIVDDSGAEPCVVGMIDFEDDPLEVMSLAEAQVRDWLSYLQSTLWDLQVPQAQVDAAIDDLIAAERPEVRALFAHACRRLGWLRCLPTQRKYGRDTIAVQAAAAAAHRWRQRHPRVPGQTSFPSSKTQDDLNP